MYSADGWRTDPDKISRKMGIRVTAREQSRAAKGQCVNLPHIKADLRDRFIKNKIERIIK